jgi:hypothetical protein
MYLTLRFTADVMATANLSSTGATRGTQSSSPA